MMVTTRLPWRPVFVRPPHNPWTRTAYGTGDEPALRCGYRAVCSVACLAWIRWGKRSYAYLPVATGKDDILWKPYLQKRLRIDGIRSGNHLGSHAMDQQRITVRTQWQSGTVHGQRHSAGMKRELPVPATAGCLRGKPTRP